MPRHSREKSGTGIYHVMLRGINRQDIFEDEDDYRKMILWGSRRDRCLGQERPHARCRLVRLKRMRKGQINFWHFKRQLL